MAFANPVQFLTNNFNEAQAALFGVNWCCDNGWLISLWNWTR